MTPAKGVVGVENPSEGPDKGEPAAQPVVDRSTSHPVAVVNAGRAALESAFELVGTTATRLGRTEFAVSRMSDDLIRSSMAASDMRREMDERIATLEARQAELEKKYARAMALLRDSHERALQVVERLNRLEDPASAASQSPELPEHSMLEAVMGKVTDLLAISGQPRRKNSKAE